MYTQRNKLSKEIQDLERLVKVLKYRLEGENSYKEGDKVSVFMRGTKADGPEEVTIVAMDPSGVALVKNAEGISDEVYIKDIHPSQGVKVLKYRLEEYNKRIEIKKSTLYNID
jgi:C4-type Zn-finger protein